jgi:hypothetical protein
VNRLTTHMRQALQTAAAQDGLRRTHDTEHGQPPWPAPPATLHALLNRQLVTHTRIRNRKGYHVDTWTITDAGREALNPPPRQHTTRPRYMQPAGSRGGDYTTNPARSIDTDQPPHGRFAVAISVTHADLTDYAAIAEAKRREQAEAQARAQRQLRETLTFERRLVEANRQAKRQHVNVSSEMRLIERMLTRAQAGGRKPPASAFDRIQALEQRLDLAA